jgi:hypothetical protein
MSDTDQTKKTTTKQDFKDYTSDLPMFDLEEVLKLVTDIHEKALETASMPEVAKGCGYASPSSTPFYRRMVAARLFRLLSSQRAELTKQALDYLKPDTEDAKSKALTDAILGIPTYAELIQSHHGKRINLEIVANGFARKHFLTKPGASLCARAFVSSIKTAGFLNTDGTIGIGTINLTAADNDSGDPVNPINPPADKSANPILPNPPGTHTHTLPLANQRKVTINAPLDITPNEISRLKAWAEVTLLVEWHEKEAKSDEVQ